MTKLIRIIAKVILCFVFASGVSIASQATNKQPLSSGVGIVKDTVGMDTLVNSLQGSGMVKVVLSSVPVRSGNDKKSEFQASPPQIVTNSLEEAAEIDLRMLLTALVLIVVIALRRII